MKQVFIILGFTATILAIILSVLPISNLAIFPGITAIVFSLIAYYFSKKAGYVKKIIPFTFILAIMALSITTYKAIFSKVEVANTEELIIKEKASEQEAIEELESLDLENIDIE